MKICNTGTPEHWMNKLGKYDQHVLTKVLHDFSGDIFSFLCSSYIYIGTVKNRAQEKKVAIIHYHSSLMGPIKFMDIQNLNSYYKIPNLTRYQIARLAEDVTSETVILLAYPNALEHHQLEFIEKCRTLILCDENGKVSNYDI